MISFPHCKINLGLNVIDKRSDGYHEVTSVMYPVPKCDILEIVPNNNKLSFSSSGMPIPGNPEDNLCLKAYHSLAKDFDIPPVAIHLHKEIPMGGGLGGGSSNGAFTLKLLNELADLNLSQDKLRGYASKLGSDCAFFIENKPQLATGRGEIVTPIDINLSGYLLVLLNLGIHISTKDAYSGIKPKQPLLSVQDVVKSSIYTWKEDLINDFESSIFPLYPALADVKTSFYEAGAVYAAMTGSGSTMFGIFEQKPNLKAPQGGFLHVIQL